MNKNNDCIKIQDLEKCLENRKIDDLNKSIKELSDLKEELQKFNNKSCFKRFEFYCCVIVFMLVLLLICSYK